MEEQNIHLRYKVPLPLLQERELEGEVKLIKEKQLKCKNNYLLKV